MHACVCVLAIFVCLCHARRTCKHGPDQCLRNASRYFCLANGEHIENVAFVVALEVVEQSGRLAASKGGSSACGWPTHPQTPVAVVILLTMQKKYGGKKGAAGHISDALITQAKP